MSNPLFTMQLVTSLLLLTAGALSTYASPTPENQARRGLKLPENLPDGHYVSDGTIDAKTGLASYTFVAPIDWAKVATVTASLSEPASGAAADRKRAEGAKCNGRGAGDKMAAAQNAFVSAWDGYLGQHQHAFWSSVGTSRAYACVYGNATALRASTFRSDMNAVDDACGSANSGWFSHASGGVDYGRDYLSYNICGF